MTTSTLHKSDSAKARQYFEDKLAFTTGPIELERELRNDGSTSSMYARQRTTTKVTSPAREVCPRTAGARSKD